MKKMLYKRIFMLLLLCVTFFSIKVNINAASFAYKDFNWEQFLEQNKSYWVKSCDIDDENCYDRIIKKQEKFYKRLYKLLANYQSRGITLDDNLIIETVFFGLTPSTFKDPVSGENNPYNLDDENDTSYIGTVSNDDVAKEYFLNETDTLKTLMNNMIGYTQVCYGESSTVPTTNDEGQKVCGGNLTLYGDKCVAKLETFDVGFTEWLFSGFLGGNLENEIKCQELASGYPGYVLGNISNKREVNLNLYWEFLENSDYFDKKEHLKSYYSYILDLTNHISMSELSPIEYEEYDNEIKLVRRRIINNIKSIVENYSEYSSNVSMMSANISSYWWPIGSLDTTNSDGVVMAVGEPENVTITSEYGLRNGKMHNGVDIAGVKGQTNVIAARDGTVVYVNDANGGLCVDGDIECGGRYGNYVIIQHVDNNYTLYAHLDTGSILVDVNQVVKQGQVIGKVGNTGRSTGPHLHFEVRVGGNDSNSSQDPLSFVDVENPEAISLGSDLLLWISALEGTGPINGDNYVVYLDQANVPTFGHGIAIKYNKELISAYGINPDSLVIGSTVPISVADGIYNVRVQSDMDEVKSFVSSKGYNFSSNQLAALVSLKYNTGNINSFFEPYDTYGSTKSLCNNWWNNFKLYAGGEYSEGLKKRRISECEVFVDGVYNMNPYG